MKKAKVLRRKLIKLQNKSGSKKLGRALYEESKEKKN